MKFWISALMVLAMATSTQAASIKTAKGYLYNNKTQAAIKELQSYVKEHPVDTDGIFLLGYAYYEAGKMDEAMTQFNAAYLIDPEFIPYVPARKPAQPEGK